MEITNKQKGELGENLVAMALMNMGWDVSYNYVCAKTKVTKRADTS